MIYEYIAILIALALDWIYPRHEGIAYIMHPVHVTYSISQSLFKLMPRSKLMGVANWFLSVVPVAMAYIAPIILLQHWWMVALIAAAIVLKTTFSLRLLIDTAKAYSRGGNSMRCYAQQLVRRNVNELDDAHVNSAVIESLAESLVDGFSSPLLYSAVFWVPGAIVQRLANTMDSSLGYMDEPYREVGWFSAKVDTAINYLPARITAIIILAAAIISGRRPSIKAFLDSRRTTPSVNAGYPMSAMAASLGVRLEKRGSYGLGNGRLPNMDDVRAAIRITEIAAVIIIIIVLALTMLVSTIY
ncbi:adenosylcobinamide-phosphate synthase [Thermocladium modestius]|uniref:Probable cobalamin biosynthesis protein CobD n=1 Tax=Thermocladium modestius TaxID=62609 RepID=A0A830GYE7_9CREN|nr:cobalamin biosynthesis protein [Thermocladium modestius]GGP22252.1 adenosylcobinamide-phosphate synthase [Thermocladium modestius]